MNVENSMTKLRARLGLKHLPKKPTPGTPQVIGELLTGLTGINRRHSKHKTNKVIRASEGIRKDADELFNQLGSKLWPDSDGRVDFPTWLLDSSDQLSDSHRLYYSNRDDRAILAELFHTFVCGRIFYYANNLHRRSNKGKHPDSSYNPNSEEPGTPQNNEVSARENDTEIENNDISNRSSPRAASPENQSNTPLLVDGREMPPNIAPVAPMFQDWPPMGNHQQEPGADISEYVDHSSMQSAKQQKRKKQNRPGQIDRSMAEVCTHAPETGLAGLPFHTSLGIQPRPHGPSEQTHPLTAQHTKRPLVGGTSESSTKRCRISSSVNVPKPSLMVKFKLTPAKDVPNRGKTAPPQQSTTSMPSPELPSLDEIIDRRSMAPIDRRSDMASTESLTQPADHQPIARQHMQATVESVAESDGDTTPVPSGSAPTQTAAHVSTLADAITQASSATQPQPDTNTQDSDSQAVAKFRELWSARSKPLFDQLLLDYLRQIPVEEVADCAHSFVENVRDQGPSSSTRSGLLAMSSNIDARRTQYRTPRTMQSDDAFDALQSAASRGLEAMQEHNNTAQDTSEITSGTTCKNISASHNRSDAQHDVEPERDLPLPDSEPQLGTKADAILQSAVADGTPFPMMGVQQTEGPTHEPANKADSSIDAAAASETAKAPTSNNDAVTDIYLSLFLDEQADHGDPLGCITLTGLTTRDILFDTVQEYLESEIDEIGPDDKIVAIKIRRADGQVLKGPNIPTMPIRQAGKEDMWQALVKTLLVHGAGEDGLRAYVKVKRLVSAR